MAWESKNKIWPFISSGLCVSEFRLTICRLSNLLTIKTILKFGGPVEDILLPLLNIHVENLTDVSTVELKILVSTKKHTNLLPNFEMYVSYVTWKIIGKILFQGIYQRGFLHSLTGSEEVIELTPPSWGGSEPYED